MGNNENGEKSKLIYFLLALLQAIILAWSWRIDGSVAEAKTNIATLQANYSNIATELGEIKGDVKTLLKVKK